jgi:hypothetical protein
VGLRCLESLRPRQIAALLGISDGEVETLLAEGMSAAEAAMVQASYAPRRDPSEGERTPRPAEGSPDRPGRSLRPATPPESRPKRKARTARDGGKR